VPRPFAPDQCTSDPPRVSPLRAPLWLLAACAAVWWWRVWHTTGARIEGTLNFDALMYWMPLLREAAAQWRSGGPPLWNPYQALGTPLLATMQAGCAYPLNALYLLLDPGWAWLWTAMLHDAIAGGGLFALCRTLGLSRPAALVGAASFSFSWLVLLKCYDQPQFVTLAWLPALFACAELLLARPTFASSVRLTAVWALQLLAGHPETIAYSALLLGAYTGVRVLGLAWRTPRQAMIVAALSAAAAGLALALTVFQWLPTWELAQHSVRAPGSLTAGQQSLFTADMWKIFSTPPGCAMLALALLGLLTWRQRTPAWFFAGATAIIALLALGPSTPLFELTRRLPLGTWFRGWIRIFTLWPLCVSVLTAAGAEVFTECTPIHGQRRARLVVLCLIVVLAVRLLLTTREQFGRALALAVVFDLAPLLTICFLTSLPHRVPAVLQRHLDPTFVLVFFCATPPLFKPPLQEVFPPRHIASLYRPYAPIFDSLRPTVPARVLSLLPIAEAHTWAKLGTYFEVPVLNDLEPLSLQDFQDFRIHLSGANPQWWLAVFMGEVTPPQPRFDARWLNLSGVRFILADSSSAPRMQAWFPPEVRLLPRGQIAGVTVYENLSALPRAWFIPASGVHAAGSNCTAALGSPGFDVRAELLLDGMPAAPFRRAAPSSSEVVISSYQPSEVRLQVTTDQSGVVLLTDAFFPGWKAEVDSVAAPVLRGDCFFRAVAVETGTHTITLRYIPRSFWWGLVIAVAAAGSTLAAMAYSTIAAHMSRMKGGRISGAHVGPFAGRRGQTLD
jgi:hypothetical protein